MFLKYEFIHLSENVGRNRFYEIDPRFLVLAKQ